MWTGDYHIHYTCKVYTTDYIIFVIPCVKLALHFFINDKNVIGFCFSLNSFMQRWSIIEIIDTICTQKNSTVTMYFIRKTTPKSIAFIPWPSLGKIYLIRKIYHWYDTCIIHIQNLNMLLNIFKRCFGYAFS